MKWIRFAFRDRPLSGKGDFGFLQIKVTKTKEQLSSHSNNKSSSFQYLLSQSFSPEQKNAFDTLSSSAAINQTNVIAMSSQSSTEYDHPLQWKLTVNNPDFGQQCITNPWYQFLENNDFGPRDEISFYFRTYQRV
ncbi:hypothetical protein HKD37_13G036924 [Glycine soja]